MVEQSCNVISHLRARRGRIVRLITLAMAAGIHGDDAESRVEPRPMDWMSQPIVEVAKTAVKQHHRFAATNVNVRNLHPLS
jgi:hypothetical protein